MPSSPSEKKLRGLLTYIEIWQPADTEADPNFKDSDVNEKVQFLLAIGYIEEEE